MFPRIAKGLVYAGFLLAIVLTRPPVALSADIQITPSVTAGVTYDSNAFLRSKNANQKVRGDMIFSLSPQVSVVNEGQRLTFRGAYGLTGNYYSFHPETNSVSHDANIGVEAMLSRQTVFAIKDYFKYSKESLGATSMGIKTTQRNVLYNDASININHEFTPRTSGSMIFANNIMKFHDPLFIDTETNSAGAKLNFKASEQTSFIASYNYSTFLFTSNSTMPPIHNQSVELGFARHISPSLELNLTGGALYRTGATDKNVSSQSDWIGHFDITKTFAASSLNAGYTRDITTTSGLTDSEGITERYILRYNLALSEGSDVAFFGEYTNNYSKPKTIVNIKSINAGVNTSRRVNTWLTLSFGYNHFQQSSKGVVGSDISSERVFVNLTAVPARWRF